MAKRKRHLNDNNNNNDDDDDSFVTITLHITREHNNNWDISNGGVTKLVRYLMKETSDTLDVAQGLADSDDFYKADQNTTSKERKLNRDHIESAWTSNHLMSGTETLANTYVKQKRDGNSDIMMSIGTMKKRVRHCFVDADDAVEFAMDILKNALIKDLESPSPSFFGVLNNKEESTDEAIEYASAVIFESLKDDDDLRRITADRIKNGKCGETKEMSSLASSVSSSSSESDDNDDEDDSYSSHSECDDNCSGYYGSVENSSSSE